VEKRKDFKKYLRRDKNGDREVDYILRIFRAFRDSAAFAAQ
jgi:hypothetical protein